MNPHRNRRETEEISLERHYGPQTPPIPPDTQVTLGQFLNLITPDEPPGLHDHIGSDMGLCCVPKETRTHKQWMKAFINSILPETMYFNNHIEIPKHLKNLIK